MDFGVFRQMYTRIFLLLWISLFQSLYAQTLNFELLSWSTPWSSRLNLQFRDLSTRISNPLISSLYPYLNVSTTPESLWIVYGGWSSTGVGSTPTNNYKTSIYSQPRTFSDLWVSTNQGYTWINVATLVPKLYLHIYCGVLRLSSAGFNIFQRGWIPAWDIDLISQDSQKLNYAAWELFVTQPFDTNDKEYCLSSNVQIYYTLDKDITAPSSPLMSGENPISGIPWYRIPPDQFFRVGILSSTHYNNSHLGGRDIHYALGGSLIQPDYGEYDLKDLWASSDSGQSWAPIMYNPVWDVETRYTSLAITRLGVMVVSVNRGQIGLGSTLFVSLEGGRSWGVCTFNASYGPRNGGVMFFDAEGYLYMMGGYTDWEVQDAWRSEISFNDLEAVAEKCQVWASNQGIGRVESRYRTNLVAGISEYEPKTTARYRNYLGG